MVVASWTALFEERNMKYWMDYAVSGQIQLDCHQPDLLINLVRSIQRRTEFFIGFSS